MLNKTLIFLALSGNQIVLTSCAVWPSGWTSSVQAMYIRKIEKWEGVNCGLLGYYAGSCSNFHH